MARTSLFLLIGIFTLGTLVDGVAQTSKKQQTKWHRDQERAEALDELTDLSQQVGGYAELQTAKVIRTFSQF